MSGICPVSNLQRLLFQLPGQPDSYPGRNTTKGEATRPAYQPTGRLRTPWTSLCRHGSESAAALPQSGVKRSLK
jgi:hypothetical protein